MSYLVLARKSRPQRFEEVVGQQAVVRTLRNALDQKRVAHALIFSGVRGTGKTTLARIMAKALNCEQGPTSSPCNQCASCCAIREGNSVDLQEVDGASNRGIQEIRELKEKIRFMPVDSRFKIFIIDEVHMLTSEAFNALLKTLEEPPPHVYFLFATTELHKVPVTILSRCQRFELKRVSRGELFEHFKKLSRLEGVAIEDQALHLIVREAGGSVRDGLSLLDQVFSYCGTKVTASDVAEVLGMAGQELLAGLVQAVLASDLTTALTLLDQVYQQGMDHKRLVNELLSLVRNLLVCRLSAKPSDLLDLPEEELEMLTGFANQYSTETLMQLFALLLEPLEKAGYSNRPRFQVEMALIRAVQVGSVTGMPDLLARMDGLLQGLPMPVSSIVTPDSKQCTPPQAPLGRSGSSDSSPLAESAGREEGALEQGKTVTTPQSDQQIASAPVTAQPRDSGEPAEKEALSPVLQASTFSGEDRAAIVRPGTTKDVRRHWDDFIHYVRERKQWMAVALRRARKAHLEGEHLVIRYEDSAECRFLKNKDNIKALTEYALDFFQGNFSIRFQVPDGHGCEVAEENGAGPRRERQSLANDNLVQTALEIFSGQVGEIRVGPRFRGVISDASLLAESGGDD